MRRTILCVVAALALWSTVRPSTYAAQPAAPQPARGGGAAGPAAPTLQLAQTLRNDARQPQTPQTIATPDVDLQLYGDGKNIVVATGAGPQLPRLFFGLCTGPCGFALRHKDVFFDLRGRAAVRFTTIVSGFHRVRPIIKLADGSMLIGDQAEGSTADYHRYDISFSDCRWLRLDAARGVTLGGTWVQPDLSKVDEVGLFDILPGSGEWTAPGLSVERQPPPPAGGWIAVSSFEVWGQRVAR